MSDRALTYAVGVGMVLWSYVGPWVPFVLEVTPCAMAWCHEVLEASRQAEPVLMWLMWGLGIGGLLWQGARDLAWWRVQRTVREAFLRGVLGVLTATRRPKGGGCP